LEFDEPYRAIRGGGDVTIVSTNREIVTLYIDAVIKRHDFARYFTDDVTFEVMWTGPRAEGGRPSCRR
jgi:hypothetical protein